MILTAGIAEASDITRKKLPDLVRPRYIDVDEKLIYIVNNYVKVKCYPLTDEKTGLKINIRKGEGPQEYHCPPMIRVQEDRIVINSTKKTGFYSRDGRFLYEKLKKKFASTTYYLDKNKIKYVGGHDKKQNIVYSSYDLYTPGNKKIKRLISIKKKSVKEFYKWVGNKLRFSVIYPTERQAVTVYKNKFFITFPEKQKIKTYIFEHNGNLLKKIEHTDLKKIPITPADKKRLLAGHLESFKYVNGKAYLEQYKKQRDFVFPEYFPRYYGVFVDNDKIYIMTYIEKNGMRNTRVYDMNGKKLGEQFLPIAQRNLSRLKNGNYYFLRFSDEEEEWFLYTVKLKS